MQTTKEALQEGFKYMGDDPDAIRELLYSKVHPGATSQTGYWVFTFGKGMDTYELCFEPLLWDDQMYVALYKNKELLTTKVMVRPCYSEENNGRTT